MMEKELNMMEMRQNPVNYRKTTGIEISTDEVEAIPVTTETGQEFGSLVMTLVKLKDGRYYDILYSREGELITSHPCLPALEKFFERSFKPGKLDGEACLINTVL